MAVQYHVAFSREVSGAAIFAGGPYFCALANLAVASSACMLEPLLIDTDALADAAKVYASAGDIDALDGLRGDQVSRERREKEKLTLALAGVPLLGHAGHGRASRSGQEGARVLQPLSRQRHHGLYGLLGALPADG